MVITEFDAGDPDATLHALADEILKYRLALRLLATAIGWASTGAPFGLFPGGRGFFCAPHDSLFLYARNVMRITEHAANLPYHCQPGSDGRRGK